MNAMVQQLAYLSLNVVDLDAWDRLLIETVGLARSSHGVQQVSRKYRIDSHRSRLMLQQTQTPSLDAIGLQVHDAEALHRTADRLVQYGLPVRMCSEDEANQRDVSGLLKSADLDGNRLEFCWGPHVDERLPAWGTPNGGFVGGELGFGHVFIASTDRPRLVEFYCTVLGFKVSDHMRLDSREITFLHCNPRHHSIAVIEAEELADSNPLHFMLEFRDFDDVGRSLERCEATSTPIWLSLGRHSNDLMASFYLRGPGGTAIELGWDGLLIDDANWNITKHFRDSLWGHRDLEKGK